MSKKLKSIGWLIDNWKVLAIGAVLLVVGLVMILVAGHAMNDVGEIWRDLIEYLGKALLVGAVVELVFAVILVNDVLDRMHAEVSNVVGRQLPAARLLTDEGIEAVTPVLDLDKFVGEIRECRDSLDVWVMQSQVFEVEHFLKICEACAECGIRQNAKKVRLLFCHPESQFAQQRYEEIHEGVDRKNAHALMSAGLEEFIRKCVQHAQIAKMLNNKSLEIGLFDYRMFMSVYRIGPKVRIGWFPALGWCVHSPHVHCRFPIPGRKEKPIHTLAGNALRQFEVIW